MSFNPYKVFLMLFFVGIVSEINGQTYPNHSVLSSGQWYKMTLSENGIYKIGCGDIAALKGKSTRQVAIYGGSGDMLTETNKECINNDPIPIPIKIIDKNGNGYYDDNDYLLFYGESAQVWRYDNDENRFVYNIHGYSNYNYFYINLASEQTHPIPSAEAPSTVTDIISTYTTVGVVNNDLNNIYNTGRTWMGEKFTNTNTTRNFTITTDNILANSEVKLHFALMSKAQTNATFNVSTTGYNYQATISSNKVYQAYDKSFNTNNTPPSPLIFTLTYNAADPLATGYLDFIEVNATAALTFQSGQRTIRNTQHYPDGNAYRYTVAASTTPTVWDISDPCHAMEIETHNNENGFYFDFTNDTIKQFILFSENYLTPKEIVSLDNQDLHATICPDLLIVTHPNYLTQSERLANLHRIIDGMEVVVTTADKVYNEFSSGKQDPIAIRQMLRMYYKRAQADSTLRSPKYLLIFGKGTFDNRNILNNDITSVVTYQSEASYDDNGSSFCSDDFFGYIDDDATANKNSLLMVGIGRIPARNSDDAELVVGKIEGYLTHRDLTTQSNGGDWRNYVTLVADDADPSCGSDTIFTHSAEQLALKIEKLYPSLNIDRIYADAFVQQTGAVGSFYPDVNNALKQRIDKGCLLLNYIGHGSAQYIGTERYMEKLDITNYKNTDRLTFFVTSTCSFGKYDMIDELGGAETFLLSPNAGIAIISAARKISHIETFNTDVCIQALNTNNTIGDALRIAKNRTMVSHSIALLGDPALRLSIPKNQIIVTKINGKAIDSTTNDTAIVLSEVTIEGKIVDETGNLRTDFDGDLFPIVFDRKEACHTLANDNEGSEVAFHQQKNILYKGHEAIRNGLFSYTFIVPRDVPYIYDFGKLSHYASSGSDDASGNYAHLLFGGFDTSSDLTTFRPHIRLFINDSNFRSGGITDENPTLFAILEDSVGINAVGSGLGHDITAVLDNNGNSIVNLNTLYEPDMNNRHKGTVRYKFEKLSEGVHTLTLKAWNIYNFSNSATISFCVAKSSSAKISQFTCAPNPARGEAHLRIEHNCNSSVSSATITIYDINGQFIKQLTPTIGTDSYVIGPVVWNLCNEGGAKVDNGIYVAHLTLVTTNGDTFHEVTKIIKLE